MYEIRSAGAAGLGVFASSLIPRGTRIFSERPLLGIPHSDSHGASANSILTASAQLSPQSRQKLLQLSSFASREMGVLRWLQALRYTLSSALTGPFTRQSGRRFERLRWKGVREHVTILSIFRSNAFNLGRGAILQQAVFGKISRINHSCVPNAQGNFHDGMGMLNVHATRDIEGGEEVVINYLGESAQVRSVRGEKLRDGYGFECACAACGGSERGLEGEERRIEVGRLLGKFVEGGEGQGPEKELVVLKAFVELFEGQAIAGRELAVLYFEKAKLYEKIGEQDQALRCAKIGLALDGDCLGKDHRYYRDGLAIVAGLQDNS